MHINAFMVHDHLIPQYFIGLKQPNPVEQWREKVEAEKKREEEERERKCKEEGECEDDEEDDDDEGDDEQKD